MIDYATKFINESISLNNRLDEKLGLLFLSMVISTNSHRILELGTREGCSTLPFLYAAYLLNGSVTSVDIDPNISFKCPDEFKPHWNFIVSDSIKFLENDESIYDLIYIDDWHSCPHVTKEIQLIENNITNSTIILLHDTMSNSSPEYNIFPDRTPDDEFGLGGVAQAILNLDLDVWEYSTIPIQHGLTILRKK